MQKKQAIQNSNTKKRPASNPIQLSTNSPEFSSKYSGPSSSSRSSQPPVPQKANVKKQTPTSQRTLSSWILSKPTSIDESSLSRTNPISKSEISNSSKPTSNVNTWNLSTYFEPVSTPLNNIVHTKSSGQSNRSVSDENLPPNPSSLTDSTEVQLKIINPYPTELPIQPPFPDTSSLTPLQIMSLYELYEFFSTFSALILESELTYSFDDFANLFFDTEHFLELHKIFISVGSFNNLFSIIPSIQKDNEYEPNSSICFLQPELAHLLLTIKTSEYHFDIDPISLSKTYSSTNWLDISPLIHIQTLHFLVFGHVFQSIKFINFYSQTIQETRNFIKDKSSLQIQRRNLLNGIEAIETNITEFDTLISESKKKYEEEIKNQFIKRTSDAKKQLEDSKKIILNAYQNKRNEAVIELQQQTKLFNQVERSLKPFEINADCLQSEIALLLRRTSNHLLGVDRNGSYYWWFQNSTSILILIETINSEWLYFFDYSQLLTFVHSLSGMDINEILLSRSIANKIQQWNVQETSEEQPKPSSSLIPRLDKSKETNARLTQSMSEFFEWQSLLVSTNERNDSPESDYWNIIESTQHKILSKFSEIIENIHIKQSIRNPNKINYNKYSPTHFVAWRTYLQSQFDKTWSKIGIPGDFIFEDYGELKEIVQGCCLCDWLYRLVSNLEVFEKGYTYKASRALRNSSDSFDSKVKRRRSD